MMQMPRSADRVLTYREHLRIGKKEPHFTGRIEDVAALPTAGVQYRGMLLRVEGATGVTDTLYMCMKAVADTYSWRTVATGG